jgi:hypothetical protein
VRIISATCDGERISNEQIRRDTKEIRKEHKKALREDPMWSMFGGLITIQNRVYQVCE